MTSAQKRLVLIACILGTSVVTVDATVVNVALPAIEEDLGGGLAGQQWTSNAYLVTLGSLLLIGGSLGDVFGERRVFTLGVAGFGATSLCLRSRPRSRWVVGRALQGVAGALLTPRLAVIVAVFPSDERGRAVGAWTAWGGIGTVLGRSSAASSWTPPPGAGSSRSTCRWCSRPSCWPCASSPRRARSTRAKVDVVGATLCALGLAESPSR